MTTDQLQDELLLLGHHLEDAEKALASGKSEIVTSSLGDMKESLHRLAMMLNPKARSEIKRLTPEVIASEMSDTNSSN